MLNLRQKISQLLCVGFDGLSLDESPELSSWLNHEDGLGFLILFDYDLKNKVYKKNIKDFSQLRHLTQAIKKLYQKRHPHHPPIGISIDVEGGRVDRLAKIDGYSQLPSAKFMAQMTAQERHLHWKKHAQLLQSLDIDLNFAPVVDLDLSPKEGIFGPLQRCFSSQSNKVVECAQEYIETLNQYGIYACLKHFPGHGSARGDSHLDFVDVSSSFSHEEIKPYAELIANPKLQFTIMTAHVINQQLDDSGVPATLSKKILTNLLRRQLHFSGLIISDDLQMHAIAKFYSRKEALLQTLMAGTDMIIFGNQLGWDTPTAIIDDIESLILEQRLPVNVIERAYDRVYEFKKKRPNEESNA